MTRASLGSAPAEIASEPSGSMTRRSSRSSASMRLGITLPVRRPRISTENSARGAATIVRPCDLTVRPSATSVGPCGRFDDRGASQTEFVAAAVELVERLDDHRRQPGKRDGAARQGEKEGPDPEAGEDDDDEADAAEKARRSPQPMQARRRQGVAEGGKAPARQLMACGVVLAQKKTAFAPRPRGATRRGSPCGRIRGTSPLEPPSWPRPWPKPRRPERKSSLW